MHHGLSSATDVIDLQHLAYRLLPAPKFDLADQLADM